LIISINVGLFGFTESLSAPFAVESVVLEIAAAITVAAWMAVDLIEESRYGARTVQTAPHLAASGVGRPHTCIDEPTPAARAGRRRPTT